MGKLTATIRLESTDIWPTPVKINNSVLEQANGDVDIQTITIPGASIITIIGPTVGDPSSTTYIYMAAASTNGGSLIIDYAVGANKGTSICVLRPGDFLWFPLYSASPDIYLSATNNDMVDAKIDVLFANRG